MKHLLLIGIIAIIATSCNPILYPMPGKNYDEISNIKSRRSYDSVWAGTLRFFTNQGYTIKTSDKDKGVLVTEKYEFNKRFSFVKNGKPMDTTAWVALSYTTNKGGFGSSIFTISAYWSISIKTEGTGSIVRIDLSKVNASATKPEKSTFHPAQVYTFQGQSTGVFEKMLADAIK